jgi:hypothetical protein
VTVVKKDCLVLTMAILAVSGVTAQSLDDIFNKAVSAESTSTSSTKSSNGILSGLKKLFK